MAKANYKRRKDFFSREIVLEKLLAAGEISAVKLIEAVFEILNFSKAMIQPSRKKRMRLLNQAPVAVEIDLKSKVAFWSMLHKLRKENLITKNSKNKIVITEQGKDYLRSKNEKPSWIKHYSNDAVSNEEIILVIFDIPEEVRTQRDWIRFRLEKFGFQALQKSVWWGTIALPKQFIKDLKKYDMLDCVHIFSVKKQGTISSVIKK